MPTQPSLNKSDYLVSSNVDLGYGKLQILNKTHCRWQQNNIFGVETDFFFVEKDLEQ